MTSLKLRLGEYCVPDLEFDGFVSGGDDFGAELDSDGRVMVKLELSFQKLEEHATFAHTCINIRSTGVPDDDVLKQVAVGTHLISF